MNGMNLSAKSLFAYSFATLLPGLCQAVAFVGAAFDGAGFDAVAAERVDLQVAQGRAGPGVGQSAKCVGETEAIDGDLLTDGRGMHDGADQVVDQREDGEFLQDAGHRLAVQDVHLHGLLEMTQVGFDLPALAVEVGQGLSGVLCGINERGDQRHLLGATTALHHPVAQLAKCERSGQGREVRRRHPLGANLWLEVFDQLVTDAQTSKPA